jgi:poly(A) polymerase
MNKKKFLATKLDISNKLINDDVLFVIKELQKNGYDGYIVGGGIRDLILKKKPKDFDIVTNATPEIIKKIFKRNSIIIGRRFKIVHVYFQKPNFEKLVNNRPIMEKHIIEVSTYRSNNKKNYVNEHGRIMIDNNYGKQKDDAIRRDFTINSIYYDPIKEVIIDYHNGLKDLENKTIKMIGDPNTRYIEDPVRILRALRLAIKLDLNIDKATLEPIKKLKHLLKNENIGRRYEEMLKILLSGTSSLCIKKLKELPLPKNIFPLFDEIYFKKNIDLIANEVLNKTDNRINLEESNVSVSFLLASILWHLIYPNWQHRINKGDDMYEALEIAIEMQKNHILNYGVMRNIFTAITSIWKTQITFENPNLEHLNNFVSSSRFRQGLHLFNLRHFAKEVDPKLYEWWNQYAEATKDEEKIQLQKKLTKICNIKIK